MKKTQQFDELKIKTTIKMLNLEIYIIIYVEEGNLIYNKKINK